MRTGVRSHIIYYPTTDIKSQPTNRWIAGFDSSEDYQHPFRAMADFESKLRGYLVVEARKRRTTWMKAGLPNARQISADLGLGYATIHRIIYGRGGSDHQRRDSSIMMSPQVAEALKNFFRFSTHAELIEAVENSESVGKLRGRHSRKSK